jgi:hypothetical protein
MTNINIYLRKRPLPDTVEDIVTYNNNKLYVKKKKNGIISYTQYDCNCLIKEYQNNIYCYQHYLKLNEFIKSSYSSKLIFTYGQTGSGKTHTITGTNNEHGLLQYTIQDLIKHKDITNIQMSTIEIYNNKIYDLQYNKRELQIYQYCNIQTKYIPINQFSSFLQHMTYINEMKKRGKTAINNNSSRSHIIYTFHFELYNTKRTIVFIDLAGNERGKYSLANNKQQFIEYSYINQSLFALKECIRCNKLKCKYIPYRRSKLTMILKLYFKPSTSITLFSTIHPRLEYYYDITDTIHYTLSFISNNICVKNKGSLPTLKNKKIKTDILQYYFEYIDSLYNLIHNDQIQYKKYKSIPNKEVCHKEEVHDQIIKSCLEKQKFINDWQSKIKNIQ